MTGPLARLEATIEAERSRPLDWSDKAVLPEWYGCAVADVALRAVPLDRLSTPLLTLDRGATDRNVAAMAAWCAGKNLSLAPHGKTTMAPGLWHDQLRAGAWAIAVANEPQLRVARGAGVPRVFVPNLFLRPDGLRWLAAEMDADPGFEFFCWVDSTAAVELMDSALGAARARRRVPVLVELGHPGARTGARTVKSALAVADAVAAAPTLALAGVAGYEGSVTHDVDPAAVAQVDEFLLRMVDLHHRLLDSYEIPEAILSAGGSAFFDRVAAVLGPEANDRDGEATRVVIRSGAYVVHDDGYYRSATPHRRGSGPTFEPALHVWSRVISMAEPGLAHLDAGKRDFPFDEGLPEVQLVRRLGRGGAVVEEELTGHQIVASNDQHAHVRVPDGSPLQVGDVVRLGISHPCTAFDKWSLIPVIDDSSAPTPVVVDLLRTHF
jgi:D-serine deaminase-like pyridoxal phosphate-dependent protein